MKRHLGVSILTIMVLLLLAGALASCAPKPPESTQAAAAPDGATLLRERCSVCHSTDRITQAHATNAEWETIVTSMVDKGAQLTNDEKKILVDYLAATYGG